MCFNDLKNGFGGDDPPMIQVWAVAPEFEKRYRNLLVEAIVLAACRLTDKRTVAGKKTISISVLPEWFAHEPNLKKEMTRLIDTATTAGGNALRPWRNWQLAHTAEARERPSVCGNDAEAVVDAIQEALAFVWRRWLKGVPELPDRPASASIGEHLSRMHKRMAGFETWLMEATGHDTQDGIHGATAAVRHLAGGPEAEAADPGDEPDPVVEFIKGAREAREIADRITGMKDVREVT